MFRPFWVAPDHPSFSIRPILDRYLAWGRPALAGLNALASVVWEPGDEAEAELVLVDEMFEDPAPPRKVDREPPDPVLGPTREDLAPRVSSGGATTSAMTPPYLQPGTRDMMTMIRRSSMLSTSRSIDCADGSKASRLSWRRKRSSGTTARSSRRRTLGESWLRGFGARSRNGLDHDPASVEPDSSALGPIRLRRAVVPVRRPPVGPDALILCECIATGIHDVRHVQRVMCPALAPRRTAKRCAKLGCVGERNRWATALSAQSPWFGRALDQTHNPPVGGSSPPRPTVCPGQGPFRPGRSAWCYPPATQHTKNPANPCRTPSSYRLTRRLIRG